MNKKLSIWCLLFSSWAAVGHATTLDSLLPEERNNVEVFQKSAPKVVYVHRIATIVNRAAQRMSVQDGAGSGIIWDEKGHVVTNYHVIRGADNLAISIGKKTFPVKVIGAEPRKDIAVLAITSPKALELLKSFKPFTLAPTNELLVGQKAMAIGNPFGLDHTLTIGVISALERDVPGIGGVTIHDMIQTDASINPGNSGGPLLDSSGRLIGLNTIIYSNSGSSAGIGFAVPSLHIERIVNQIIRTGRVELAGIGIQRVDPNTAMHLGVKQGVLIGEIVPNTPAQRSGLQGTYRNHWGQVKIGDVIVALNGHPINNYDVLYNLMTQVKVGEKIKLTVVRDNQRITHTLKTIDIGSAVG